MEIENNKERGIKVFEDLEDSSKPPSLRAQRYRNMYAYRYHYRVKSLEENVNRTFDSGVATIFWRPCQSRRQDQNLVNASLEYIRQIQEILKLDYRQHYTMVLVCKWVKANYHNKNATMKKDEWGFTLVKFQFALTIWLRVLRFSNQLRSSIFLG